MLVINGLTSRVYGDCGLNLMALGGAPLKYHRLGMVQEDIR